MFHCILRYLSVVLFVCASPVFAQPGEATFEGVGDLPGGSFSSTVYGVSGDGSVVVGIATPEEGVVAFRWEAGVMDSLGFLPGAPFNSSMAFDASEDGSVIVGQSNSEEGFRAFRWEDGVMEDLGVLPDDSGSGAYGVSDDGNVAVGFSNGGQGLEAVRWEAGDVEGLGRLEGGVNSSARAVSADGSVVVGQSDREGFNVEEAFRWEDGTMEGLGYLAETAFTSWAYDVTVDGSIVVGMSQSDYPDEDEGGDEAFLWEAEADSMIGLGDLPGGFLSSWAQGVSGDGSVVVGQSSTEDDEGNPLTEAFIWTQEEGMRSLKDVLEEDYGLDLTAWALQEAIAVSNDGTVIVGNGTNPDGDSEGWRAELPSPVLPPDNDDVADAIVITEGESYEGTNFGATLEPDEAEVSCVAPDWSTNFSVWWSFTPQDGGLATISTEGSDFDTVLSVRTLGLPTLLNEIACNDNAGPPTIANQGSGVFWSLLQDVPLEEGETYLIRVAGYNEQVPEQQQGDIQLAIDFLTVDDGASPKEIAEGLSVPKPNPVRATSTVTVAVARGQEVSVEVFDVTGRRVQTLYDGILAGGRAERLTIDANSLPAGVYVIRATGEDVVKTRRVTVIH